MPHLSMNARVIAAANTRPVLEEIGRTHTAPATEYVLPGSNTVALAMENLSAAQAGLL